MAKGGGSTQTTTVQSNDPWSGAQPFLKDVLSGAQTAYNSGGGFSYPNFNTTIPFADQTLQALQGTQDKATSGNPLGDASQSAALGILGNNGLSPFQQQAGAGFAGVAGGQQPNAIGQNLSNYANGSYVNGGSPQFLQALDYQSGQTADDVNRQFSNAGRYGSMAQGNELVDRIGQQRNSAIANEMAREQGQQIQAAGMQSGEQQQGIGNQLSAFSNIGNIGQQGAGNSANFAGLAPSIYGQQYAPYQQLGNVGSAYQDLATRQMQENTNRYNMDQQSPWARLGAYSGLVSGQGQMGGTQTTSVPAPSPWQGALGGGLLGAQVGNAAFPGIGGLVGGGLGGLLGLLG